MVCMPRSRARSFVLLCSYREHCALWAPADNMSRHFGLNDDWLEEAILGAGLERPQILDLMGAALKRGFREEMHCNNRL